MYIYVNIVLFQCSFTSDFGHFHLSIIEFNHIKALQMIFRSTCLLNFLSTCGSSDGLAACPHLKSVISSDHVCLKTSCILEYFNLTFITLEYTIF